MKRKYVWLIVMFLIFLEILSLFLTYKSFSNKSVKDEKEIYEIDKKQFSMYIENEEGNYEEYIESNKFPEGYQINIEKSKCVDTKGNVINGILTGNGTNITITSSKTSYCYLYFDIKSLAGDTILSMKPIGLDTSIAYNEMYRYIGTDADNYISLDGVIYRIIGITSETNNTLGLESGQLKVIKAESIGTAKWYSTYTVNATWNTGGIDSELYTYLNDTVLNDTSIIPSTWLDKISSVKWYAEAIGVYNPKNASYILEIGTDIVTSSSSKIGLIYLSDYYYAYTAGGTIDCSLIQCISWATPSQYEWTMTAFGYYAGYQAWRYDEVGYVANSQLQVSYGVRPVLYLNANIEYVSGTGTMDNPFIVS